MKFRSFLAILAILNASTALAQTTISALPAATTPTGTEIVPIVQGGVTKRTTAQQIANTANNIASGANLNTPGAVTLTNGVGLPLTTGVTGTLPVANLPIGTNGNVVPVLSGSNTWSAKQIFPAATTGSASINVALGSAPSAPADGDKWLTANGEYSQISGAITTWAPHVGSNTALSRMPSILGRVIRDGFAANGDAPTLLFYASASPCSLNSGSGDGGSQVPSLDGKCWLASFPSDGMDMLQWGAKCDNSTDNSTAIQGFFNAILATGRIGRISGCPIGKYYNFSTTIQLSGHGPVTVKGDGYNRSVLNYTGAGSAINLLGDSSFFNIDLEAFGIYNVTKNTGFAGLYVTNSTNAVFKGMGFYNQYTCLKLGSGDFGAKITQIEAGYCGASGGGAAIEFGSDVSANNAVILGGHVHDGGGYALSIPNGQAIEVLGLDSEGNYGGITAGGGAGGVQGLKIGEGSYIELSGTGGNVFFAGSGSTGVSNVELSNSWLGQSSANNWIATGLIIKNLVTFNYAPFIASGSRATVENTYATGTGGLSWAPGTTTQILAGSQTFATLPACNSANAGATAYITDASAAITTWHQAVTAGGGTNAAFVSCNGTGWFAYSY